MTEPLSIYVLVDALGWEIIRDRPFLDDVLGERRWLTTILGYSSGAIPTILSGRTPSQHGHWNLFYRDPERSPFRWTRALGHLPRVTVENRVSRRVLKAVARRVSGYSGYFSLYDYPVAHLPEFDLTEKRDIYQPGGLDCPSIFDDLVAGRDPLRVLQLSHPHRRADPRPGPRACGPDRRPGAVPLSRRPRPSPALPRARSGVGDRDAGVVRGGPASRVAGGARGPGRRAAARLLGPRHDADPVDATTCRRDVQALGLRTPDDYLPAYDSTMARFWIRTERARTALTELLTGHPCGTLMSPAELQRLGVWFDTNRYYDLLFLMKPGMLLSPSDMGTVRFAGMHGYHPSEPTADAVLLSTVPVDAAVTHITGVHSVLLEDLNLTVREHAA